MKLSTQRFLFWLRALLWTGIIFATLPYARTWSDWLTQHFTGYFIPAVVIAFLLFCLIYTITRLIKSRARLIDYILIAIVTAGYIYSLLQLKIVIEQVHFLEYGILANFSLKAVRLYRQDSGAYLITAFAVTLIGVADECVQGLLPDRIGELHDVYLNIISGLLALCWYRIALNPVEIKAAMASAWTAALPILGLILLLIGFFNSYLSDFGFLIIDHEIGAFYSRRRPADHPIDPRQIANFQNNLLPQLYQTQYSILLKGIRHTLSEEALVHIFRRDRHLRDKDYITVYRENQILEKYFHPFIAGTTYQWPAEKAEQIRLLSQDKLLEFYTSPVASHVITSFSEKTQWTVIIVIEFSIIVSVYLLRKRPY